MHHFAHKSVVACAYGVQTGLHLAAKEILSLNRRIAIPSVEIRFNAYRSPIEISPARHIELDVVVSEKRTGGIIPDILAHTRFVPLLIEVYVTHAVDESKIERIRELGISALEIDLSTFSRTFSEEELADAVVNQTSNKKWLFNSNVSSYSAKLIETGEVKRHNNPRGLATRVDDCPRRVRSSKAKFFANVIDDCAYCEFVLELRDREVVCGGTRKIRSFKQLKKTVQDLKAK